VVILTRRFALELGQHGITVKALNNASHASLQFVPFTGDPPAINNLLGGHKAEPVI
jgi:tripartite-type tricarboxylate transporter receptor subunit TctC